MVLIWPRSLQRQGGGQKGRGVHLSCGVLVGRNKLEMLSPSLGLVQSYCTSEEATLAPAQRCVFSDNSALPPYRKEAQDLKVRHVGFYSLDRAST